MGFRSILALMVLVLAFVGVAAAGDVFDIDPSISKAADTALVINDYYKDKVPLTTDYRLLDMSALKINATDLTNKGSYKITIKSSKTDSSSGILTMNINAWRDTGKGWSSIKINNPVHFYIPWDEGEVSKGTPTEFSGALIMFLDTLPYGEPVNDDTLVVYPEASTGGGGRVAKTSKNETFSTIIDGTGTAATYATGDFFSGFVAATAPNYFSAHHKLVFRGNTSDIPDGATITSATLHYYGVTPTDRELGDFSLDVVPADIGIAFATDDFNRDRYDVGTGVGSIGIADWQLEKYNNFTLTNFTPINKTGYTTLGVLDSWDRTATFGGTWAGAGCQTTIITRLQGSAGTGYDPFMTIIYTPPADTTPPDSITDMTNTSVSCSALNFDWNNPGDSDYGNLMVWRNNTALTNLSNTTTSVAWTGLPESTDITFSSITCDLIGNCNASYVNMTRTTEACGVAPVAAFAADDTTVCTTDTVTFTDSSSNTPTSWNWSFGDGNVSSLQNPTKIYNITGTYTVNLSVANAYGSDNEVKTNYITVSACASPTAPPDSITGLTNTSVSCSAIDFDWNNPTDADYGSLMVWRNNTALTNLSNTTTGVSWTGLPESKDITISTKTCDLTGNCNASYVNMTRNTGACGVAPVAAFSASDTTVCTVDTVTFTDASTNVPASWNWSLGDGNLSTLKNPTKIYNIIGTYTVNLSVANAYGSDNEVKTNYITVSACAAPTTPDNTIKGTSWVKSGTDLYVYLFGFIGLAMIVVGLATTLGAIKAPKTNPNVVLLGLIATALGFLIVIVIFAIVPYIGASIESVF